MFQFSGEICCLFSFRLSAFLGSMKKFHQFSRSSISSIGSLWATWLWFVMRIF
jgi:hypothetical protein